jgi:hypothetical protein
MKDDTLLEDNLIEDFSAEEEAEIQAIREKMYELVSRYPICHLLTKTIHSHWRLQQLQDLKAPVFVLEKEKEVREGYLSRLAQAFPLDTQDGGYFLNNTVDTLYKEIYLPSKGPKVTDA